MQQTKTPVSKIRMALMWLLLVGLTVFWIVFLLWRHRDRPLAPVEENPDLVTSIIMGMVAGFFLIAGLGGYFIFLVTNGFTFNFTQPVWSSMKSKLYLANVVVLTGTALGFGFGLAPFVNPWLVSLGMSGQTVRLLPVMALIVLLQIVRIFVLIWAPLERRLIARRLLARGISPAQLQTAALVGISDPSRSSFKKFSQVEDDIGALWIGPEQLIYWGDTDQFAIGRDGLAQIERKADPGGTTMLGGVTHIILHVRVPDGGERQIRLHAEGHWTMGQKGRAMDQLEERIVQWQSNLQTASGNPPKHLTES